MQILSSTFAFDGPVQVDGSRWVVETHTLADGTTREYRYLLDAGDDAAAIMAERAAAIEAEG